ncbi:MULTISPECIES: DUF1444 family protein [Psychrobacillus]|uniref:DUF1444 family protein n=1 Tax=Psychrobacillus faecigallinarum TaxID=2762235 RepID=A0ABR8R6Q7_9BACI|nr:MULTISPECIES: DUF1444 family protein [Psychrobacillus]MBD7943481.1 DUF1444 family protein [Psychrobacillus faecigallinarum]QEY22642.1 DUF1444 family protein [Psychrobacillus sp. AK 1817]QGM29513.1 DUF1444 family protein [Bacillus sp. N3536]
MKALELIRLFKTKMTEEIYMYDYNRETNKLRLTHKQLGKGMDISIPPILAKYETKKEEAINEVVYTIQETFSAMEKEMAGEIDPTLAVYPVIRSTSFPLKSNEGNRFVTKDHTAETRVYYALDLGNTYRLLDEKMLASWNVRETEIRERALFQVRNLKTNYKTDEVAGNIFYFFNNNDGYDASRILNESLLKEMKKQISGDMTVSVPHQDVMIIGDIRNETGYDVLAQMTMHFFTVGTVPITSLSFIYDKGDLEPIFILAKNRVTKENEDK